MVWVVRVVRVVQARWSQWSGPAVRVVRVGPGRSGWPGSGGRVPKTIPRSRPQDEPFFVFFAGISHECFHVVMNRQGHNNIRNGIVWVQTGHSTCTCTATVCVCLNFEHTKDSNRSKKFHNDKKSNSNLIIYFKNPPKSFGLVSGQVVNFSEDSWSRSVSSPDPLPQTFACDSVSRLGHHSSSSVHRHQKRCNFRW